MHAVTVLGVSFTDVLNDLGYAGLLLLLLAETIFPPIPSEAILPLAGYLVGTGEFNFAAALATSTAGSLAGAWLLYEAARFGGRPFALRFLRFARLDPAKLDEAETWFNKRGAIVVLAGRCIPGARSLVSLPAGLLRMPRMKYLALTLIGSLVWNTVLISIGWALGNNWEQVSEIIGPLSKPLLALAVIGTAAFLWYRGFFSRSAEQAAHTELEGDEDVDAPSRESV